MEVIKVPQTVCLVPTLRENLAQSSYNMKDSIAILPIYCILTSSRILEDKLDIVTQTSKLICPPIENVKLR